MASEWRTSRLEDCVAAIIDYRGKTPNKVSAGVPLITAKIVKNGTILKPTEFVADEDYDSWMTRGIPKRGDVILTTEAPLGEVAQLTDSRVALAQRIILLRGKEGELDNGFLSFLLRSEGVRNQLISRSSGTTVSGIKQSELRKVSLCLPPYSEQKRIGALLGALSEAIRLKEGSDRTLEAIARAIFKSWFVDFEPVRAKAEGREPEGMNAATAALFPGLLNGELPQGWSKQHLGTISQVGIGKTPPRKEPHWFSENPGDVAWVSIRDMGEAGIYIADSSEYLTRGAVNKFNVRIVPDHTVIVSFKLTVGRLAITDGELATNEAIAHCVLLTEAPVSTEYLYCALSWFDFASLASTSSIAEAVNSQSVRNIVIAVPGPREMRAFTALVKPLFERIKNNQRMIATLCDLRDTLLPRLISGKLRVPEAEKLVEALV